MIGKTIRQYQIIDKIGEGGMGAVYKAEDTTLNRLVALKVLSGHLSEDEEAQERFIREAQSASSLNHPNITTVHEFIEDDDTRLICMEYIEGKTIRDMVESGIVSVRKAIDIIMQTAEALGAAHNKGILHRDVKSANIMVTMEGRVKVMDFGLAHLAGMSQLTRTGTTMGTLSYSSPEQISGRFVDQRSELFSLGVVFYELLTGQLPFKATSEAEILFAIVNNEPPRLTSVRDDIPESVEAVVSRMLEKDPELRYQTCGEVINDLKGIRKGLETSTVGSTAKAMWIQASRESIRHRGLEIASLFTRRLSISIQQIVLIFLIVLLIGGAVGSLLTRSGRGVLDKVGWFSMDVQLAQGQGKQLDISPDGSTIVFIGLSEDGETQIFRRELSEPDPIPIAGTKGSSLGSLTISPDGQSIGFIMDQELWTVSLQGGGARSIARLTSTAFGANWGAGDIIVYKGSIGEGLKVISASGGEARILTTPNVDAGEIDHRLPEILPDGKSVVFTIWRSSIENSQIGIASIETGEYRILFPGSDPKYVQFGDDGYLIYINAGDDLMAIRFDQKTGQQKGAPATLLSNQSSSDVGAANYAVSANGTFAFLNSPSRRTPVLVDREGITEPLTFEPADYTHPRLSPDGQSLALALRDDIHVYQFELDTFAQLTFEGGFYPAWTPDGDRIVYSRYDDVDINAYEIPVDRSEDPVSIIKSPEHDRVQCLSKDGRFLMIRKNIGARYELWIHDRNQPESLESWLRTEYLERAPEFSPNGKWVAYSSDESGRDEIYVRPFPGPGGRIPISTDGGTEPAWSHDGSEIYYRFGDRFQVVSVNTEGHFQQLSQPRTLFKGRFYSYSWFRQYDPHPDGQRFLMLLDESQAANITIALNWIEGELHRLLP